MGIRFFGARWSLHSTSYSGLIVTHDLRVVRVLPDGPAARSGIRPGDRVLAVDGRETATLTDYLSILQAPGLKGREVSLRLGRGDENLSLALAIPLVLEGRPLGCVFLGPQGGEWPYTKDERRALEVLGNQLSVAIAHAETDERIEGLNRGLEAEVAEKAGLNRSLETQVARAEALTRDLQAQVARSDDLNRSLEAQLEKNKKQTAEVLSLQGLLTNPERRF